MEAVILYSTNDYRFFDTCISNLILCDIKCHVVTYSNMWNGSLEDYTKLESSRTKFKDNELVKFYTIEWNNNHTPFYWEGLGRYLATREILDSTSHILYIDVDEIIDPIEFKKWLDTKQYEHYEAIKLSTYWYWREPIYQATTLEDSVVILKTSIAKKLNFKPAGREIYFNSTNNSVRNIGYLDPMIHHYSWVRTKEEMLAKVYNWGHSSDRTNWTQLIETEFSEPFNGTDFVHGYRYNIVENKFNL